MRQKIRNDFKFLVKKIEQPKSKMKNKQPSERASSDHASLQSFGFKKAKEKKESVSDTSDVNNAN